MSNTSASGQSNDEVLRRAQAGDPAAFAELFQSHKSRVYFICLRMTKNVAEAEDLTQDAFMQVFRKLGDFRGDSAFSTWLHRVAVNTVLMHFRKKSLPQLSLDQPTHEGADGKPVFRDYSSTDNNLAGCVDRIALHKAIEDLPEGYRTVFLLHEIDGYEHQEIAKLLGCSVGNSKSQLHKARLRIREFLAKPGPSAQQPIPVPLSISFGEAAAA